jgi:hypothetical protein
MTITAATMDLTTAYYIVDSADDMLTAEELALRPAAEALINKPAEVVAGPMSMSEAWDLYYRGRNGNVSDDELDRYAEAVEKIESIEREKAEKEAKREAELDARLAELADEEEAELLEKFGADTLATVRAWYETHNKFGLADSFLDAMVDSGVMEDTLDEDELDAFKAFLAEGELSDVDEDDLHELAMERRGDYPEHFPISNAMIDGLGDIDAEVANEIIHGF